MKEWTAMRYEDLVIPVRDWEKWRIMTAHFIEEDTHLIMMMMMMMMILYLQIVVTRLNSTSGRT